MKNESELVCAQTDEESEKEPVGCLSLITQSIAPGEVLMIQIFKSGVIRKWVLQFQHWIDYFLFW